ncbi:GtrA family protein [Pseudomonas sp. A-RE-19]|uniref:GtrA family protein n=1 Tax=Pseudomonas sp. A-RE-19 TaxID=2832401 RepID=UPI001CBE7A4C|nr:GtrA family protein [Pseudomonas sp. A-RE-19]
MQALWKGFTPYAVVGVANTLIHWQIFYVLNTAAELSQAASNFAAFCVAASFSFYVNALYTFDARVSVFGYLLFVGFMGVLSFAIGRFADVWRFHGLVTVASYSSLSLFFGFFIWRFVVFREREA